MRDTRQDVPAAQQSGAEGHEVGDVVGAIADELVQDGGDEGEGFGVVEADAAGEAALGEVAEVGEGEFVYLLLFMLSIPGCCKAGWSFMLLVGVCDKPLM